MKERVKERKKEWKEGRKEGRKRHVKNNHHLFFFHFVSYGVRAVDLLRVVDFPPARWKDVLVTLVPPALDHLSDENNSRKTKKKRRKSQ